MIISIDGTLASGKSTITKTLEEKYGFECINTGIYFRKITLAYIKNKKNINIKNRKKIYEILKKNISNEHLFNTSVDLNVSKIASYKYIRKVVYDYLKIKISKLKKTKIILEGRDVFYEMKEYLDFSFFLDAKFEIRVKRRLKQNKNNNFDEIKDSVILRDKKDKVIYKDKLKSENNIIKIDTSYIKPKEVEKLIISKIM